MGAVINGGTRDSGTARHHLESYLLEFIWRQHQLKENRDCFESMLNSIGPFSTEIRLTTLFLNSVLLLCAKDKIALYWRFSATCAEVALIRRYRIKICINKHINFDFYFLFSFYLDMHS